jgi:pimeloyl-ACP methyl ester carboxylesterase
LGQNSNWDKALRIKTLAARAAIPCLSDRRRIRSVNLVLVGRDDPLVPPVNGRILARLIPNARLQMIDDGPLFMVTRPVETAKAIEAFLFDNEPQSARAYNER